MMRFRKKRVIAGFLAACLLTTTFWQNGTMTSAYAKTCEHGVEHEYTGLTFWWTDIPTTSGEIFGWPRKTYFKGGDGVYANMNNMYCFCVANHETQAGMGVEAYLYDNGGSNGVLTLNDYDDFQGNIPAIPAYNDKKMELNDPNHVENMKKFSLCLAAAAVIAPGQRSDAELKDPVQGTYMNIMAQSVLLAIEGRIYTPDQRQIVIDCIDKEAARQEYYDAMQQEYHLEPLEFDGKTTQLDLTIRDQVLANRDTFFDQVWDAAIVMYNAIQNSESGLTANKLTGTVDPNNPNRYIITVDCHGAESVWNNYYSKIKIIESPGWSFAETPSYDPATGIGTLVVEGPAGVDLAQNGVKFQFEDNDYLTDLSKPVLYQFNFCEGWREKCNSFQVMFCAFHETPTFEFGSGGGGGGGGGGDIPGEGTIELEIHRYKHTEDWRTTYNVDLIKYDSETGKPLSDSTWDILEYDTLGEWNDDDTQLGETYLDHPADQASNIGTNYNWANDDGTQFTRWGEDDEDPCSDDVNITGDDGYLYQTNSVDAITSTKAHTDTYDYTYTKGYCTGHPKPIIHYYECDHDPDDDCDCEEKNAKLDKLAEEAWQEQVDYCEQLAEEGGFFHTSAESISDEAKKALETDRDQFYEDFISLTYDYSAEETEARDGYILHDEHTDDIPIERVTIHSSEYLDEIAGGGSGRSAVVSESEEELNILSLYDAASPSEPEADGTDEDTDDAEEGVVYTTSVTAQSGTVILSADNDNDSDSDDGNNHTETADIKESNEDDGDAQNSRPSNSADDEDDEGSDNPKSSTNTDDTDNADNAGSTDTTKDAGNPENGDEGLTVPTGGSSNNGNSSTGSNNSDAGSDDISDNNTEKDDKASPSDADDSFDPENPEVDFELLADGTLVETATLSDAEMPERRSILNVLKESIISLFSAENDEGEGSEDGEGKDGNARDDKEPPKKEGVTYIGAINFETSDVTPHTQGATDIECWTFIAYDHRTEGEIHFNKRDLNLAYDEEGNDGEDNDAYDKTYADENGDGTLEGAVYGLFAARDIVHPDSDGDEENELDTGIVYKEGDLVAVATTDRNGDGSFMTFTEAPGMTYNYDTGRIEKRTDTNWDGPSNLHTAQDKADAAVEDNEKFYGWDAEGENEVTLTDSEAGDGTYYDKHSSNQGLNKGLGQDDGTTYPILNNEDNNGNCWIGRPLIVSGEDVANYYIKELSRSEGYELSVYGKDMEITNKDAFENGGDLTVEGDVSIGSMDIRQNSDGGDTTSVNTVKVSAADTNNGFDITFKNLTDNEDIANFSTVKREAREEEKEVTNLVMKEFPVMAEEGQAVLIDGSRVEAELGDVINLPNGNTATVNNTITISGDKLYVPTTTVAGFLPNAQRYSESAGADFMEKYNTALGSKNFGEPEANAPWILVAKGANENEAFANMTAALADYTGFDNIRIVEDLGSSYAVQYSADNNPECLYDVNNQIVWIRKDVMIDGAAGYLYARYDATALANNGTGFIINNQAPSKDSFTKYEDLSGVTYSDTDGGTFWAYAEGEQMLNSDGSPATYEKMVEEITTITVLVYHEVLTDIAPENIQYDTASNTYTIHFDSPGEYEIRIGYDSEMTGNYTTANYAKQNAVISWYIEPQTAGTYIQFVQLDYPGQTLIISDGGTTVAPTDLYERPIRQKIKVSKDIQTLAEPKTVWYCLNCGNENQDGTAACGFCGTERTTEETKTIRYAHDTYSAVHKENISADRNAGVFDTVTDWLTSLLGGTEENDSAADIPNFRFKAYLKSNLERLYRDEDGNVIWMDRNGNTMTPQYEDTNGDGNYDTFTWKYDEAYDGKTVDFPEKDIVSDDGTLESANVQKIYTKVKHVEDSDTTSAQANNVWSDYEDPQLGATENAGEKNGYSTSLRETADGESGDLSGMAVRVNDALYSYDGKNTNTDETDRINDNQNSGYTRILETRRVTMEDNDATREVEMYNYEKFFDGIAAANADIWDDDMHSTFTGDSMSNYPGQHWFETFYEKYQKDDADPDHTMENTDGADADNTAGGDRDTSFKPFRWIRENVFGDRDDYEKYPAEHNGENTEVTTSTSDFAKANAEASDAVRQFATKWYLEDEAAKLMTANGIGEDIAKDNDGEIEYDEAVYDEALFNAIAKAYNYLKPFYYYDLDTIYSVEWDSEPDGGADNDYTTLSIDNDGGEEYYNISGYLPYGTYVIVEQQPQRIDGAVNDWENRSYTIEKPKEVILPAVYDAAQSNDTTDNYDEHYNYSYAMDLQDQAASDNYLIRFGEEWPHNNSQDEREYVIRAHNYFGDFEVYKYGLDIDKLQDTITYDGGDYAYAGFGITQEEFDPLKDYYETTHRGEAGVPEIGKENGGNDNSHLYAIDKTDGDDTANGTTYDGDQLEDRFFYGSISEDAGIADDVMYKGGTVDDNNASGMQWKDGVRAMTGELTAYEGKYASMLVPWTVTAPADLDSYSSDAFSGYADVNMRDGFFTTTLRVNKVDSETGEYILHDNAIFGLYAGSRYQSFEEIEEDAKLIEDPEEREMFLEQFKPGDAKFYLQDTVITGSMEFLQAMGAKDITKAARGRSGVVESGTGAGELYSGTVPKGTPICLESEKIMLTDEVGARTGQMTVYTTLADVLAEAEDGSGKREYINQNIGWFETPQPIGAGVYVLAEIKAPAGYARSKPVAYEVYSDGTYYYPDGDMYGKVKAVRYEKNLIEDFEYQE